jgi:hypothetical protein
MESAFVRFGERQCARIVSDVESCPITYTVSTLPPGCLARSRAEGRKPAQRLDGRSAIRFAGRSKRDFN